MKFPISFILGFFLSLIFLVITIISFFWVPHDVETLNIANRLKEPSFENLLGTDHFGRDIFSMIMIGGQTSLSVALIAVGLGLIFGAIFARKVGEFATKNNIKIRNVSNSRLNGLSSWFGVDHLGARGCCSLGYRL